MQSNYIVCAGISLHIIVFQFMRIIFNCKLSRMTYVTVLNY